MWEEEDKHNQTGVVSGQNPLDCLDHDFEWDFGFSKKGMLVQFFGGRSAPFRGVDLSKVSNTRQQLPSVVPCILNGTLTTL